MMELVGDNSKKYICNTVFIDKEKNIFIFIT